MQARFPTPRHSSKNSQIDTPQTAQMRTEPKAVFTDARSEAPQLHALQTIMRASPQYQKQQTRQTHININISTHAQQMQAVQARTATGTTQRRDMDDKLQAQSACDTAQHEATVSAKTDNTGLPHQLKAGLSRCQV